MTPTTKQALDTAERFAKRVGPDNDYLEDTDTGSINLYEETLRLIAEARVAEESPVGWLCKVIVNKHASGPPLPGQIQISGVWGTPSNHIYFSVDRPIDKWVWWEAPVYLSSNAPLPDPPEAK